MICYFFLISLLFCLFIKIYGYRGAIVLTMAGQSAPEYLSWSCQTIGPSKDLFDMIIFHEDNKFIEEISCPSNVIRINLHENGIGNLISKALLRNSIVDKETNQLTKLIPTVLKRFPYFLAEFKTGTGDIFRDYLKEYTHWTYTDPDIFWANLTQAILPSELSDYDIITLSLNNDGARLFLRGQFSLHKNKDELNNQWKLLPQFQLLPLAQRLQNIITKTEQLYKKKTITNEALLKQIKSHYFFSAEGAYSSLIFNSYRNQPDSIFHIPTNKNNFKILIAGRMMSDKITKPVIWQSGNIYRCACGLVNECLYQPQLKLFQHSSIQNTKSCLYQQKRIETEDLIPPLRLRPLSIKIGGDCRMGWIYEPYRLCGSSNLRKRYNEVVLENGKWFFNDERSASRRNLFSGAFFHFRMWEDSFSKEIETIQPTPQNSSCLITYLSLPIRGMYVHPCDEKIVQSVPILTLENFFREKYEAEKKVSTYGTL